MTKWLSNQLEPSRLRATIVAALALAGALGIIGTTSMPGWADGLLAVFAVLWPSVQHMLVRPVVTPTAKIETEIERAYQIGELSGGAAVEMRGQLVTGTVPVE